MRFDLNEDQTTFATVLEQMLADTEFRTVEDWGRYDYGAALDAQLDENGFFDAAREDELGTVAAALMVYQAAQAPVCIECAASSMLRPFLGDDIPRPLAVKVGDAPGAIRYLPQARGLVALGSSGVTYASVPQGAAQEVESLYAYPMGKIDEAELEWETVDADSGQLQVLWQIASAAELGGVLKAGMETVLDHVRERKQFGQPLGAFQALQHRLAVMAVEIEGAKLMMLRAAQSRTVADAALAQGYIQACATRITYDLHQFMGAMGLTLEHPLHRWSYRAKLLRAELGGSDAAYMRFANDRWGAA